MHLLNVTFAVCKSGLFINCDPAFVACKPMMLLIRHFFQHELGFATICALEFSYFVIVIVHAI